MSLALKFVAVPVDLATFVSTMAVVVWLADGVCTTSDVNVVSFWNLHTHRVLAGGIVKEIVVVPPVAVNTMVPEPFW